MISRQLESEVEAVLEHLYATRSWFRRPGLLERTLVDQLENVLAAGKQVIRTPPCCHCHTISYPERG